MVFLAAQNPGEWERFCAPVLELPELATDPRFASNSDRAANWKVRQEVIEGRLSAWDDATVEGRLEAAEIATARLRTVGELLEHPQLRARGRWAEIESDDRDPAAAS